MTSLEEQSVRLIIVHDTDTREPTYRSGHKPDRDIIAKSAVQIIGELLARQGYNNVSYYSTQQLSLLLAAKIPCPFDAAFNLAPGSPSPFRFGHAPIILEALNVPYSGNDPQGMLVCRNKWQSKMLARAVGLKTPTAVFLDEFSLPLTDDLEGYPFPAIVKPNYLGGSLGIQDSLVTSKAAAVAAAEACLHDHPEGVLLEEFIAGQEVTVLVVGNPPNFRSIVLCLATATGDRLPEDHFLSYSHKTYYAREVMPQWFPAEEFLSKRTVRECRTAAEQFVSATRLRDFNRLDFRIDSVGQVYFLECNSMPNLGPVSSYSRLINAQILKQEHGLEWLYTSVVLERFELRYDQNKVGQVS